MEQKEKTSATTNYAPSKVWRILCHNRQKENDGKDMPSFKEFLSFENEVFDGLIENKTIDTSKVNFQDWLNKKYKKDIKVYHTSLENSDSNNAKKLEKEMSKDSNYENAGGKTIFGKAIKNATETIKEKLSPSDEYVDTGGAPGTGTTVYKAKTVLGMKPIVAYMVGAVVLTGAIYGGYRIYKSIKSKK